MNTPVSIRLILFAWLLVCSPLVAAAEIQSSVSRNPVALNESFELSLQATEAPAGEPDFAPLTRDFDILNQNQSQNIQVINGEISRSLNWNLVLMPKHEGVIQIPPIMFGSDASTATTITVNQANETASAGLQDDIFIKLEAEPRTAYVQQQVILKVQLFRAVNLGSASLSEPETDNPNTIIKKLGGDTQFETSINNRQYVAIERKYAVFPQQSGKLTINPIVFQGEVRGARSGNSLFNDRFGGFNQQGRIKRLRSDALELDIRPAKPAVTPWLPTSNLQLMETWGTQVPEFRVGEPVTRTFMLLADGLSAVQLPAINQGQADGFKQYPEQPSLNDRPGPSGTTGIRQEKVAVIPTRAGRHRLPAIEIDWWNTEKDRLETSTIPEREVRVLEASPTTGFAGPAPQTRPTDTQHKPIEPETGGDAGEAATNWLAIALGSGWLLTVIAWWIGRRRDSLKPGSAEEEQPAQQGTTNSPHPESVLKKACLSNDPQTTSRELLIWASVRWPDSPPLSLGGIAERIENPELTSAIKGLEAVLYAPEQAQWTGESLWNAIRQLPRNPAQQGEKSSPISPLYPA